MDRAAAPDISSNGRTREPHWSTQARRRRRRRAGHAARRADRRRPPRRLRPDRPRASRDLFIRHALVEGDWDTHHRFFRANRALLEEVEELETRARRRDLSVDDETLFAFYDERIPADVVSGRHFDSWWKKQRDKPACSTSPRRCCVTRRPRAIDPSAYPDHVAAGGLTLPLSYAFEPGRRADGVTVDVPVAALNQVDPTPFTWQVPGLREELVTALIKIAAQDPAAQVRARARPRPRRARPAERRRRAAPRRRSSASWAGCAASTIPRDAWELDRLPEHLTVTFRVVDERGAEVARGTDLEALRRRARPAGRGGAGRHRRHADGLTTWTIGELPREIGVRRGRHVVTGYPGLVDRGDSVDVRVFPTAAERDAAHARGVRRLLLLDTPSPARQVPRLDSATRLVLARNPHGSVAALVDDCVTAAADALINAAGGPAWDERGYARLKALFAKRLPGTTQQVLDAVRGVLTVWHRVQSALTDLRAAPRDLTAQLDALVGPGFATRDGATRLADVARYLGRPSGGSRSCASTRPATRRGRRRSPSSPTSTRSWWPPSRPAPSRRPRCARSAG